MEPSSYSHSSPAFPSLSWVVCCFLIPDSWVFIWFVAWWAGGGAAVARRGSKVDGNPNLITIQLCILCILWLDPTTSNPASCATLKFFRQFFSFHALEIRPPTLFHGHNCTIICHLFHWLVFLTAMLPKLGRVAPAGCAGGLEVGGAIQFLLKWFTGILWMPRFLWYLRGQQENRTGMHKLNLHIRLLCLQQYYYCGLIRC